MRSTGGLEADKYVRSSFLPWKFLKQSLHNKFQLETVYDVSSFSQQLVDFSKSCLGSYYDHLQNISYEAADTCLFVKKSVYRKDSKLKANISKDQEAQTKQVKWVSIIEMHHTPLINFFLLSCKTSLKVQMRN